MDDPAGTIVESQIVRILKGGESEARTGLIKLLGGGCTIGFGAMAAAPAMAAGSICPSLSQEAISIVFNRVIQRIDVQTLLARLSRIEAKYGTAVAERALRTMDQVKELPWNQLSDGAFEGFGVFLRHAPGETRVHKIWDELVHPDFLGLPEAQALDYVENLCQMWRSGDRLFGTTTWWHNFVARGAGTSRTLRSTTGHYYLLEHLLAEVPLRLLHAADREGIPGYSGRPDVLLKVLEDAAEFIQRELKAIGPGRLLTEDQLAQFQRYIDDAFKRAPGAGEDELRDEFKRMEYWFAGHLREDLKQQLLEAAKKALGPDLERLAKVLYDNIKFKGTLLSQRK
jgi:hypothetical protein